MFVVEWQPALFGRLSYAFVKKLDYLGLIRLRLYTKVEHSDRPWKVAKVLGCVLEDLLIFSNLFGDTRFDDLSANLHQKFALAAWPKIKNRFWRLLFRIGFDGEVGVCIVVGLKTGPVADIFKDPVALIWSQRREGG